MQLKHVEWFVRGACQEREERDPGFTNDLHQFTMSTLTVVWRYLRMQQRLDGTCSDFDCHVALEAEKVFGREDHGPRF